MVAPSEFCDVNGVPRFRRQIYRAAPFVNYTTFLAVGHLPRRPAPHDAPPAPEEEDARHRQYDAPYLPAAGKLPVWHLMGNETDCMVGNPVSRPWPSAVLKGYGGFDREQAYEALKQSAMLGERGVWICA